MNGVGLVVNCDRLNIRANPWETSTILGVVNHSSEVMVDTEYSNKDFYKICTASGIEGYCIKRFIELRK